MSVIFFSTASEKTSIPYRNPNPAAYRMSWKQEGAAKDETAQTVLWELHSPSSEHLFMPFTWPDFIVISMTILENIDFFSIFQFLSLLKLKNLWKLWEPQPLSERRSTLIIPACCCNVLK